MSWAPFEITWSSVAPGTYRVRATAEDGRLLAREAHGVNPGAGRIRLALVAGVEECLEAADRIVAFTREHA